ncbi:sp110 nuclear body protein isoform X3 [Oryctolagus cuniculus]|uniref:sp110 nuclear body protein isoform X3 n=1 Tax=Oryctolagus cuniculus TaxID=9986 RepID=UPI00387A1836
MPTLPAAWDEALLQHFTCRKLEIAYAIHKPFPFFEGLRDKAFITERMYTESLEACRNLVPVSRVVYNVLTRLEQTFSLQLLEALFSQINLREYPRLAAVLRSFRGACASHGEWSRPTVVLLEGPPDPAEGSRLQTLLPLPAPPLPPPSCLPTAHRGSEPGGSSASTSEPLPGPTVGGRSTPVVRDDSPEPSDPEEPGEALSPAPNKKRSKRKRSIWSTPKKRHRKTSLPRASSGIQEKLPVVEQATHRTDGPTQTSGVMTRAQKARAECAQVSRPEEASSGIQEKLPVVEQATHRTDGPTQTSGVMTRAQKARAECARVSRPEEAEPEAKLSNARTANSNWFQKTSAPQSFPRTQTRQSRLPKLLI